MNASKMLCNPFCNPQMLADLEKCRVLEIAREVWELEGYAGTNFFLEPPSGNIFILRDGDLVLLMDTGHHGFFRSRMLEVLTRLRREGARELVLLLSHGHWDHGKNNDIIFEAGYEKARFLLPEPELATLDIPRHMQADLDKVRDYYDPLQLLTPGLKGYVEWARNFPEFKDDRYQEAWRVIESLPGEYDPDAARAAYRHLLEDVLCPDQKSYLIDRAEPLALADRKKLTLGDVELTGWSIGRFFIWHDASQSPGHVCVYDPRNKLMITGDATLEINPPLFDCDFNACIETSRKCLTMTEGGYIEKAADCHRSSQWWPRCFSAWGLEPLSPVQLVDVARGRQECLAFYSMWVEYFTALREEVLKAHLRIGEASVGEIVDELRKSKDKNCVFKLGLTLPNIPASPEILVAKVLAENETPRCLIEKGIVFKPLSKWSF